MTSLMIQVLVKRDDHGTDQSPGHFVPGIPQHLSGRITSRRALLERLDYRNLIAIDTLSIVRAPSVPII
jgi:hypothetical protein